MIVMVHPMNWWLAAETVLRVVAAQAVAVVVGVSILAAVRVLARSRGHNRRRAA